MLESESFDVCKNVTALIIAMLGHSEVESEVLDTGIEIMGLNDCREMSEDYGDANSVLAVIWGRARFSYKDG